MASEQPSTLSPVPEATKHTPEETLEKVPGRKERGSASDRALKEGKEDTWERGQCLPALAMKRAVMVPISTLHLPPRISNQRGQMESWRPGGWAGPQGTDSRCAVHHHPVFPCTPGRRQQGHLGTVPSPSGKSSASNSRGSVFLTPMPWLPSSH